MSNRGGGCYRARMALALGCEFHGESVGRRRRNDNRNVAFRPRRSALPPVSALAAEIAGRRPPERMLTVPSMPWKVQAITARAALWKAPSPLSHKQDALAGLAEAQVGTLELAALKLGNAQPVVFVQ